MANCSTCATNSSCSDKKKANCSVVENPKSKVGKIIGVMSGKGGVGKSTVTALLATALARAGKKVGVLDADITGPSIPRVMGVSRERMGSDGESMLPVLSKEGVRVASLNLILEEEDKPVIWRGALITNTVLQFWKDVNWGELDYLLVDMPPGTGDVALTVMQSLPLAGVVMVSLPQEMVSLIVGKAIRMAGQMEVPVLGVVENLSYIECECGKKVPLFGSDGTKEYLTKLGVELLAELPMSKKVTGFGLSGVSGLDSELDLIFDGIALKLNSSL